ncbi:protein LIKE COV 1 isoform X1 [Carya illinoinensis]|uniref:protein LIKE COV 1 isoform X1 n=1 Tax=Carya illinoinensis TaxID=32201 RepID=UPI001C719331|nr:protein LIKE COV 1 isoform X1 [Carya illinoinensis]
MGLFLKPTLHPKEFGHGLKLTPFRPGLDWEILEEPTWAGCPLEGEKNPPITQAGGWRSPSCGLFLSCGLLISPFMIVILFPIAITFYLTWWFIHFVDGFFSPIYAQLGIDIFGLGFVTSITFIFLVGVFMSSWLGASVLALGEWFIKRMPFVRHIYSASKQISSAISPDQNTQAFKEVAIIRHPRIGEYAFGFITSSVVLQNYSGEEELYCVYVPTNHLYIGDIFLVNTKDVIRPNLSVREGIEIVVSGGMSMPQILSTLDSQVMSVDRSRLTRS